MNRRIPAACATFAVLAPLASEAQDSAFQRDWENVPRTLVLHAAPSVNGAWTQPPADPPAGTDAPPAADPPVEAPGPSPVPPTRADLAKHYLNVDRLFMPLVGQGPRRVSDDRIAQFNRDFDTITGLFFMGGFAQAIAKLDELALAMGSTAGGEPAPSLGTSIAAAVEPPVWWPGSPATPRVRVRSFATSTVDAKVLLDFRWDDGRASPENHPALTREVELKKGRALELDVPLEDFGKWPEGGAPWPAKTYRVTVRAQGYREWSEARFCITPGSLDEARMRNVTRLAAALKTHPALTNEVSLCRARNRVLVDYPGTLDSAEFLADYPAMLADIEREVAELTEGRNPYRRVVGEVYRPIVGQGLPSGEPVACVVYAPSKAIDDTPRPVVVALHGAGGDESMFIRSYGGGRLAQLAEEKGFILASVQSYKVGGRAAIFDRLLEQLSRDYAVDPARVYVIGHSLGAGATTYLASERVDSVAAAVCFAGYGRPGARCAPTLVLTGALDPISRLASDNSVLKDAAARNLPIEVRSDPNYGHTLIVGAKMDEAVEWLLSKSLRTDIAAPAEKGR